MADETELAEWEQKYRQGGTGYGMVKKRVVELLYEYFRPFRQKREELDNNPDYVEQVLCNGAAKARAVASETMKRVRDAIGLGGIRNA